MQHQQGERGQGGVVGDGPVLGHLLEPGPRDPLLPHVLLLGFPVRWSRPETGREEGVVALVHRAVRAVQVTQRSQLSGPESRLLAQFQPGEIGRITVRPGRETALREGPATAADRVPVFLDQVKAVVFGRDDQGKVGLLDERVGAAGPVPPLDLVLPQPEPGVLVDDAGLEGPDVGLGTLAGHPPNVTAGYGVRAAAARRRVARRRVLRRNRA